MWHGRETGHNGGGAKEQWSKEAEGSRSSSDVEEKDNCKSLIAKCKLQIGAIELVGN
jgi:hypothetical protein